jgi:hypothetical protein
LELMSAIDLMFTRIPRIPDPTPFRKLPPRI